MKQELRLYVPQQFVGQFDGSPICLAGGSIGRCRASPIGFNRRVGNGGLVEITGWILPGSRIITAGTEGLKDGERIRITGEDNVQ